MAVQLIDTEAEDCCIGSAILKSDPATLEATLGIVTPDMFTDKRNGELLAALADYLDTGRKLEIVTLRHWLNEMGRLEACGGVSHIVDCCERVGAVGPHYALDVRALAYRRKILQTLHTAYNDLHASGCENWLDRANDFATAIRELIDDAEPDNHAHARQVAAGLDDYYRRQIKSGFPTIDNQWIGFARGELHVPCARPSQGKSTWVNCITANMAKNGEEVIIISLEMSKEDWLINLLAREANIDGTKIRRQCLTPEEKERLDKARQSPWLKNIVFGSPSRNIRSVIGEIRRICKKRDIAAVVVDYFQLLRTGKGKSIYEELSEVSHRLKRLAVTTNTCVIAVAQINRGGEEHRHRSPTMSDIKGCGDIEQDADGVWILYRPEVYYPDNKKWKGLAKLELAKCRNGQRGKTWFLFRGPQFDFKELDRDDHPTREDMEDQGSWHPGGSAKGKGYY